MSFKDSPLHGDTARCIELGGHCYEEASTVLATIPPIYYRTCYHCGYTQHGYEQPSVQWVDAE